MSTSESYDELARYTELILDEMRNNPGFISPDTDLKLTLPELSVEVDRDRAADLGVPVDVIGRTLETCSAAARSRATSRTPSSTT